MARLLVGVKVFVAAVNPLEAHHVRARYILQTADKIVLTDRVANKTVNVIARRLTKQDSIIAMRGMMKAGRHVEFMTAATFAESFRIYSIWKSASFADVANIEVMRLLRITQIATFNEVLKGFPGIKVIS